MPSILDNQTIIKKLDPSQILASIGQIDDQCRQAWREAAKIALPKNYKKAKNIITVGMGGSALGAHIIKSALEKELKKPFEIVNHYTLPAFVNQDSLVFLISYSGTTEEVLTAAEEAKKRKAKTIIIASGGKLAKTAKKNKWPAYIFKPRHNPSAQPRLGLGYLFTAQIVFLKKLGLLPAKLVRPASLGISELVRPASLGISELVRTEAKKMALALKDKAIILIGSEHLLGNLHALANQINENAKQFSCYFSLPEMNHHLMEGLVFPKTNKNYLKFVFFESNLYHPRVRIRYPLTKEILKKQGIKSLVWRPKTKTPLQQAFEALVYGSYLSFYSAILNQTDPSRIPWVDYFKNKLQ